jgi:hypothetical protein
MLSLSGAPEALAGLQRQIEQHSSLQTADAFSTSMKCDNIYSSWMLSHFIDV